MTYCRSTLLCALFSALPCRHVAAQCTTTLQGASPAATVSGEVHAMTQFDPDGAGPAPSLLAVAGKDLTAGDQYGRHLLVHDGTQWLGTGFPVFGLGPPLTAAVVFNGELVVGGDFHASPPLGGTTMRSVARWNGTTWTNLGLGVTGTVRALVVHNGELFAAGDITHAGFTPANNIAKWNGTAWVPVGSGVLGSVRALASFAGQLWVGGALTAAGGSPVTNLARWNGSTWSAAGNPNAEVRALAIRTSSLGGSSSLLFAAGAFTSIGGITAQRIASVDGVAATTTTPTWNALGAGLPDPVTTVAVRNTGLFFEVVAGVDSPSPQRAWRWNGTAWTNLGVLYDAWDPPAPTSLVFRNGTWVVGIAFAYEAVRAFAGATSSWSPVRGPGIDGAVYSLLRDGEDLIVGGAFTTIDGITMNGIARRSGGTWHPLGSGVQGVGVWVKALARLPNGDLIAGGGFSSAGGVSANNIARWDGTAWSPIGAGCDHDVWAMATLPNGHIVVAGEFTTADGITANRIASFDGAAWHTIGGGMNSSVTAVAVVPNGDILAGGGFSIAGGIVCNRVARWNGSVWSPLGNGIDGLVLDIDVLRNGDVVAGGTFTTAGGVPADRIARFHAGAWHALGAGADHAVWSLLPLPNGDLLAAGQFTSVGAFAQRIARWNGAVWSTFGSGVDGEDAGVYVIDGLSRNEVVLGGTFARANSTAAGNLARLRTDCPATTTPYGIGCSSPAGTMVLAAMQEPWVGGTFASRTTGIAAFGFAIAVGGFQQIALPIVAVLPQGYPGCTVLAAPDFLEVLPTTPFGVDFTLSIPPSPSLAGVHLFHQTAFVELDANFAIAGIASSNGLDVVLGLL